MTYTIADLLIAALAGAGTAALIVWIWRQPQPEPQPEPAQAAEPAAETRAALHAATDAIDQMRSAAHAYKELAEIFEASLAKARQEAAEAGQAAARHEERAAALQYLYVQRTQQALAAGFTIVIDHGNPRRHPEREEPE